MIGPGDEVAGTEGPGRLRASQAGREQVIDALKDAFVQGRLDRDEFGLRVSKVLAGYAELDALTADIPAGPAEGQSPEPARQSHNNKVIQRGTAAGAGMGMAFTAAMMMVAGTSAVAGLIVVPLVGFFLAILLAGLLTLLSWALERGSGRRRPVRPSWRGPGGAGRGHGEERGDRTGGYPARPTGMARLAGLGRPAVRGRHQPEPRRPLRHGVLAAEPAAHAAAVGGPPSAGRDEGRDDERRGHGRAGGCRRHRQRQGRGAEEVADRPGEHQPGNRHDSRQPGRRASITDHGQPLFACRRGVAVRRCPPSPTVPG